MNDISFCIRKVDKGKGEGEEIIRIRINKK